MNNSTISSNVSSSTSTSVGLSSVELWIQLLFFYLTIGGWASVAANAGVLLTIFRNRQEMHSRFFVIVAALSITKGILAFQTVVMTLYRIFRTLGYVSILQTRLNCLLIHFFMPPLFTVEILVMIILVVDRALAIVATNYYRTLTPKQIGLTCAITISLGSAAKLAMAFAMGDTPMLKIIACINVASPVSATYQEINANIDLTLVLILLISYLILIIGYHFCASRAKNETTVNALKRQKKVLVTLRNVVLLHCAFTLTAKVVLTTGSAYPGDNGIRLMAYGGMITQCDEFVSVIALIASQSKLKSACFGVFKKCLNRVVPEQSQVQHVSTVWKI